jgi:hypothetical protein
VSERDRDKAQEPTEGAEEAVGAEDAGQVEEDLLGPVRSILSELPSELRPERDLLPGIAARAWRKEDREAVDAVATVELLPRPETVYGWWRASHSVRVQLAAAAIVLIVVTSMLTALAVRGLDGPEPTTTAGGGDASVAEIFGPASYPDIEVQYADAIGDLLQALERQSDSLTPETRSLIEENLQIIDAALQESLAALRGAPDDAQLRQAVVLSYERKLGFLRQAAALTSG